MDLHNLDHATLHSETVTGLATIALRIARVGGEAHIELCISTRDGGPSEVLQCWEGPCAPGEEIDWGVKLDDLPVVVARALDFALTW